MPKLSMYRSPADQAKKDLGTRPALLDQFAKLWNTNINGFTQQSILGNPWTSTYSALATNYFNPLETDVPPDAIFKDIFWNAMPGRIGYYNSNDWGSLLTPDQINEIADFGTYKSGDGQLTFPNITKDPCSGEAEDNKYGPYGPRGWQDEYTEWCVTRDAQGNILRIDFTCENPEYWYTLWRVSSDTALEIYQETLDNPAIRLEDLFLRDPADSNKFVIDPSTGKPAYNPLNKWNNGPLRTATGGGAMHLTSTPNTLQTETGLAGAATIQRKVGNSDPEVLICCADYGQPFRNSDPHIGQVTNQVVSAGYTVTLADPPGLYIQMPDFSQYVLPPNAPSGAKAADYWKVVRGAMTLDDQFGNPLPGNLILHAVFEVPAGQGFTVSDIKINGKNVRYASQIAATFSVQLNAMAFEAPAPAAQECVGTPPAPNPQPLQIFFTDLWNAYYNTPVPNPVGFPMNLASNTVIIPPLVSPGQDAFLTLICTGVKLGPNQELPVVQFLGPVVVSVLSLTDNLTYAVPGNTYPGTVQAVEIKIHVQSNAPFGLYNLSLASFGSSPGADARAFLNVQPPAGSGS